MCHKNEHWICRLLVFAQGQCNQKLSTYLTLAFYFELLIGIGILFGMGEGFGPYGEGAYWVATAWPITKLPVFFMGICAGVICIRFQSGDKNALECKWIINFICNLRY